jgi:uncharacterized protein (TIGR02246 family)
MIAQETVTQTAEEALMQWMEEYVANNNKGDFENYGSFWTEDAIWLPPGAPAVYGKAAILEFANPFFTHYRIKQEITVQEINVVDDFGYIRGETAEEYTPVTDELKPLSIRGKGLFLFKKQTNGSWLGTHCVWNFNSSQGY